MSKANSSLTDLEKKVARRQGIVIKLMRFVEDFVMKNGKQIKYSEGSSHTHIVKEFKDFDGFYLTFSSGESMFGGNTARISSESGIVFRASYCLDVKKDCKVNIFHDEKEWLPRFEKAVRNKEKILAMKNKREKRKVAKQKRREEKDANLRKLQEEANRLGL